MNLSETIDSRVLIVAEIGDNHNGDLDLAVEMVREAKRCGADAVKIQSWITEEVFIRTAPMAGYQKAGARGGESLFEMNKRLELSLQAHQTLMAEAAREGILFFSKAGSLGGLEILKKIGVPIIKVGSADLTFSRLLMEIGRTALPVILSTGMSTLEEVAEAVRTLKLAGAKEILLLHCTSSYPAPYADVNLNAIRTLRETFSLPVGYSDHTLGMEVSIAAVALGARCIEKHFTLDRTMEGPDHAASLEPRDFARMVEGVRNIEWALGDGCKKAVGSELETREKMRKSLVAATDIHAGSVIGFDSIAYKRPGTGLPPRHDEFFIGKKAKRKIDRDEFLDWDLVES